MVILKICGVNPINMQNLGTPIFNRIKKIKASFSLKD